MPERQILSLDDFYRKALAAKQKTGPGIAAGSVEVMETLIAQVEPDPADDRRMTFTVWVLAMALSEWLWIARAVSVHLPGRLCTTRWPTSLKRPITRPTRSCWTMALRPTSTFAPSFAARWTWA